MSNIRDWKLLISVSVLLPSVSAAFKAQSTELVGVWLAGLAINPAVA
jgi:hypothetical protein